MLRSILAVKIPAVKRAGIQTWSKNSVCEMAQRIAGYVNLQTLRFLFGYNGLPAKPAGDCLNAMDRRRSLKKRCLPVET